MKFKEILRSHCADIVAAAVFVVAACIYCFPVLQGKVINAGDTNNAISAAQECVQYHDETGDYSWWTGSMFCGMPNYQVGGGHYKSDTALSPLYKVLRAGADRTVWKFIFYFLCFFILLRAFGVNGWVSIAGALAMGLSSYFIIIIGAGHNTKCVTIALTAVVVAGFYLIFRKKYILGGILTMLFVAGGFSLHPQMFYYYCLMIGLLWVAEVYLHIKEKRFKDLGIATGVFALAMLVGIGTSASNVFANSEFVAETMRGGSSEIVRDETAASEEKSSGLDIEYATQWSYGIDETMSFLIPGFKGGCNGYPLGKDSRLYKDLTAMGVPARSAADFCSAAPLYWGEQPFTAGNVYIGAIICFLFVLGLIVVKGPYKWALLASTLFSVALSWGHNWMGLTEFFFKYFPMYSKFRAVSSILIVAEVAMPLLGFIAVKQMMDGTVEKRKAVKGIYIAGGITAGICLFFALFGRGLMTFTSSYDAAWSGNLPEQIYSSIIDQRAALMASDSLRSALFILAAAFTLWLYEKGKLKTGILAAALGVLVVLDMWPVDKRYFNDSFFVSPKRGAETFQTYPYERILLQDEDPDFRVLNLTTSTFSDARTSYYFKSLGGYNAAKLRRYQDLIDEHLSKFHMPVIHMLNAKYFIVPGEDGQPQVQRNPDAMGNAWWVENLKIVDNATQESDALMEVDLRTTAVLDRKFAEFAGNPQPGVAPDAEVRLTKYTPKTLDYIASSSQDGTVVFSEIYYPYGWKATIDGQAADIFRVNYMLRALNVPAGLHQIHFEFDPDSVRKGDALSMAFIVLMYLLTAAGIAFGVRKLVKKES